MRLPFNLHSKITPSCATAIAVSLLPLIYFFPATRGQLILAPDDGVIFNVPMRVVVANLIHSGNVPLWNPFMFSGMPLFGAAQAGVLFPLNWFYLIFSAPLATNLMMLSTYVLAALGAYLYARRTGVNIVGSAATSIIWQLSAFMIAKVGQTNVVQTAALFPWILWAIDRYGINGRRKDGVLLAVLVAIQIFAGHQQTFFYALLVAAAYAALMARVSSGKQRRAYIQSLAMMIAGVALAAVQILPTAELLRSSLRASASYDFFSSFSLPPRFLLTLFAPFIMGGGDGNLFRAPYIGPAFVGEYIAYVGSVTIMLALVALLVKRDARTWFWSIVFLVCLALAVGRFLPLNIYKLVYYIPVLNLFRVPARHLLEVEFALAVLAGRGLAALTSRNLKAVVAATFAGALVFVSTCLTVTSWRPAAFQLGRTAPVSLLRAPELFIPILVAATSALALWFLARNYAQRPKRSVACLFAILVFDLFLWGQASGWRLSPTKVHPLWREPEAIGLLRKLQQERGNTPYRVLTDVKPFFINTGRDEAEKYKLGEFMLSLQPDTYMMYGVENAAGYDGFGLSRYSKLAGDMKVWGELTDPERSVRGPGREFDLLNVRYLIKQSPQGEARRLAAERGPSATATQSFTPPELVKFGDYAFAQGDLGAASLVNGERLVFNVPPTDANAIALVTSLAWSTDVKDGEIVGYVRLRGEAGKKFEFEIRAGDHTAEWSHDRPDLKDQMRHRRAPVATNYLVESPTGNYESHTYVAGFSLPVTARITSGEIVVAELKHAPMLTLDVKRVSLLREGSTQPLRPDWVEKLAARQKDETESGSLSSLGEGRWKLAAESEYLQIFENTRVLPRAWLAEGAFVTSDEAALRIIHTGKLANGGSWNPLRYALVSDPVTVPFSTSPISGTADVTRHEPNRIQVKTQADVPSILVLSENHYPGWNAYVDGQAVNTLRVDYNLRGVPLPDGNHTVEFIYRPKSMIIGLLISLLTLAGLVVWAARERRVQQVVTRSPSSGGAECL